MNVFPQELVDKYRLGGPSIWRQKLYGWDSRSGIGDFTGELCQWIVDRGIKDQEAIDALSMAKGLLTSLRRWPDDIQEQIPDDRQCTTRWCSMVYKHKERVCKNWLKMEPGKVWEAPVGTPVGKFTTTLVSNTAKTRSQGDMTRDAFYCFYRAACFLGYEELIWVVDPPWYLHRPASYRKWLRAIRDRSGKKTWKPTYKGNKDFVKRLESYQIEVYNHMRKYNLKQKNYTDSEHIDYGCTHAGDTYPGDDGARYCSECGEMVDCPSHPDKPVEYDHEYLDD